MFRKSSKARKKKNQLPKELRFLRRNYRGLLEILKLKLSGAYNANLKISLCTSVKDRFEHLQTTFLRNIEDNASSSNCEFVLLNYNCPDPRTERWVKNHLQPYINLGKVNYYFYPDAKHFEMAHSRNLSFRLAQGDVVCNIDADNFIGSGFVAYVSAVLSQSDAFLRGPRDGRGLAGRICVKREYWKAVGGYDERMKNWGLEDIDFAKRLSLLGLTQKYILWENFCRTILHSDEIRTRHLSQDKQTSLSQQKAIYENNVERGIICPNGSRLGNGRVQKNFVEWLEV